MMDFFKEFEDCRLCPRECGVDRTGPGGQAKTGFCGESHRLRVAYAGPHFGEEPPITGTHGSGTIFFTGCPLRCSFCQNYQISREGLGKVMTLDELLERTIRMIRTEKVHNINFVTPDHFFPYTFRLVTLLREQGERLPIVYNLSGYQSAVMLKRARDYADIYLPDFKYSDPDLAQTLSRCRNYPGVALDAISEMVRQKGFLKIRRSGHARRGVLVRHLILPGAVENSINALTSLFAEFGPRLPMSLMSQYRPVCEQVIAGLNRTLTHEEFERVYGHAMDLGFEHLFVQFPEKSVGAHAQTSPFLPDFQREKPFAA